MRHPAPPPPSCVRSRVTDAPTRFEPDPVAALVGSAIHRVIGELAPLAHVPLETLIETAWVLAGAAVADVRLGRRARAARLTIAGAAAVYVERFLPPASWRSLGTELELGEGRRGDLGWARGWVLIDELKSADAVTAPRGNGPTLRQVVDYARLGRQRYGERFIGVRLIFLGAPNRSRLVTPDGLNVALADTPYSFGRLDREARDDQ